MKIDEAPFKVRQRRPWKVGLLFLAIFVLPIAIAQWPWKFLPLRWQYPLDIRRGERMVAAIDRFKAANSRLPTWQELGNALPMEDWPCSECYGPSGDTYSLTVTAGFDDGISYDPRTHEFQHWP